MSTRTGVLAAVGAMAGLAALAVAVAGEGAAEGPDAVAAEVRSLREETDRLRSALEVAAGDARAARGESRALARRVEELAAARAEAEAAEAGGASPGSADVPPTVGEPLGTGAAPGEVGPAELRDLGRKLLREQASPEEQERFFRGAHEPGVMDALLAEAQAAVDADPRDVAARMALAETCLLKLFTVPGGPEQGVWGMRAEREWTAVLELDPDHWDARFSLATSWSYYPDVMNRTGDALRELERLRASQETRSPEPKHAQTYLLMHRLHLRQGERERADEALAAGLRRHPDDAALRKAAGR